MSRTARLADVRSAIAEAEGESFGDDLHEAVYGNQAEPTGEPGTDGDYIAEPTGPDDEDAEWAARNLNTEGGWYTLRPDPTAIELRTVSAWDRFLDDLAATREAEERVGSGCHAY